MDSDIGEQMNSISLLNLIEERFKKYQYLENSFESIMINVP